MNIRDVLVQEQNQTRGRDAAGSAADVFRNGTRASDREGAVSKITGKVAANVGNMEVPVTPVSQTGEASGTYSFPEAAELAAKGMEVKEKAGQNLAVLTGEDYQRLEEDEGALEKYQEESLDRAVERIHAEREWKAERLEEGRELREELQKGLEQLQATGFLSAKTEAQIKEALEQADLPVTQEMIKQVVTALQMCQTASELSDSSKAFLVGQRIAPTIENIYHSQYSGMKGVSAEGVLEEVWEEYLPQIEKILSDCGAQEPGDLRAAKWLFANELPVDSETLEQVKQLEQLQTQPDLVLRKILEHLAAGGTAATTNLDDREMASARELLEQIGNIQEEEVAQAVAVQRQEQAAKQQSQGGAGEENKNRQTSASICLQDILSVQNTQEGMDADYDIQTITAQRQIAELRLSMTLQSVLALRSRGFSIEVEPLERVVQELREIENQYYKKQMQAEGVEVSTQELDLMRETLAKTADIAAAPAAILGSSVRQYQLLTVNELHGMAVSVTRQYQQYRQDFEAVGTQVRQDLGDSIRKAFSGIPALLEELGLENTEANQRAVRILGYNQMEITEENIQQMKQWDAQVNQLIDRMKPSVVLELIREGENPLHETVEELNQKLAEKQREREIPEEEKYSRFLWRLEKNDAITEAERSGYIGVYRLLRQIEKNDGAAIGAVLQSGREMTLGNLLTAIRTMRAHGVDAKVNDELGASEIPTAGNSITGQIETGFASGGTEHSQMEEQAVSYYREMVKVLADQLSPAGLREISEGELQQLLGYSLERVAEEMKQNSGDSSEMREYFEKQAADLREAFVRAEAVRSYLESLEIPDTLENIRAAEFMLEEGGSVIKEFFNRRNRLSEEEQTAFIDTLSEMVEQTDSPEGLAEQCEKAESFMAEILAKSREDADINVEDLQHLKLLGQSLRLHHTLRQKRSYEIPIQTEDSIMTMNLTIIENDEDAGRVQVSMEEEFGRISVELRIQDHQIKGLALCDDRNGFEVLKDQVAVLEENLQSAGYLVKNISCGMDFKSRSEMIHKTDGQTETAELYRAAKLVVQWVSMTAKQIEA